jgi:hypothetical protein
LRSSSVWPAYAVAVCQVSHSRCPPKALRTVAVPAAPAASSPAAAEPASLASGRGRRGIPVGRPDEQLHA